MSKFHVGDKVRIHFSKRDREVQNHFYLDGHQDLSGEWTVDEVVEDGTYYAPFDGIYYQVSNGVTVWDVPEEGLRPYKVVPLEREYIPTEDTEEFWATSDPAPELKALALARAVDNVNHPSHYNRFPVEVINITEQLDFNKGNAVKYLCRAGFKDGVDEMEDLSKAAWFVNRAIEKLKKERGE